MNFRSEKIDRMMGLCLRITSTLMIFVGGGLFLISAGTISVSSQVANTIDGVGSYSSTTESIGGIATSPTTSPVESKIIFDSTVPAVVDSNFEVKLNLVAVSEVKLYIRGLNNNNNLLLSPVSSTLESARFAVAFEKLLPGKYEISAKGKKSDGQLLITDGPRFEVLQPDSEVGVNISIESTIENIPSTDFSDSSNETEVKPIAVETPALTVPKVELPSVNLILPKQVDYRDFVPLQIRTTGKVSTISVYLQPRQGEKVQFLGTARYYQEGQWMLMVNTKNLPDGEYLIFAKIDLADVSIESDRQRFNVYNPKILERTEVELNNKVETVVSPDPIRSNVREGETPVVSMGFGDDQPTQRVDVKKISNDVAVENNQNEKPPSLVLSYKLKVSIPQVLKDHEQKINSLLRIYSEKVKVAGEIIPEEENKVEQEIMSLLLEDSRLESISPEAKTLLQNQVGRLVKQAGRVEMLLVRKVESKQAAVDLIQEIALTMDTEENSLVDMSSPKEFGLIREDLLKIESISPVTRVDTVSGDGSKVYTEIRGKALPNSLVTLYIYSSPVMVTVQADADGTFTYLYEKDLDDGEHEVYVALTTNTGAVAIKSEGFQFVREAQAFTISDSENGDILEPIVSTKSIVTNPYFIVLSVSLLIVGLTLLFIGLRTGIRREEVIEVETSAS